MYKEKASELFKIVEPFAPGFDKMLGELVTAEPKGATIIFNSVFGKLTIETFDATEWEKEWTKYTEEQVITIK